MGKEKVVVEVHCARNLRKADANGSADPFVEVTYNGVTKKTGVAKRTLQPDWNEKVTFTYSSRAREVVLRVMDKDTLSNDFMGLLVVDDLGDDKYRDPERERKWNSLCDKKQRKDASRGKIQYTIKIVDAESGKKSSKKGKKSSKKGKKKGKKGKKKKSKAAAADDDESSGVPVVRPEDRFFDATDDDSLTDEDAVLAAIDRANMSPEEEEAYLVAAAEKRIERLLEKNELRHATQGHYDDGRAAYGAPGGAYMPPPSAIDLDGGLHARGPHRRHRLPDPPRPMTAFDARIRRDVADFQAHRTSAARMARAGVRDRYGRPLVIGAFGSLHDANNPTGVVRGPRGQHGPARFRGPPLDADGYLVDASDLVSRYAGDYAGQGAPASSTSARASRSSRSSRHTRRRRFLRVNPDHPETTAPDVGDFVYRIVE